MTETKTTLKTQGIKCEGCAGAARTVVESLPGVTSVKFDLPGKTVTVTLQGELERQDVARALSKAGFPSE